MICDYTALRRIDMRTIPLLGLLMLASLLVISSATGASNVEDVGFFTPLVKSQLRWFVIGALVYLFFAALDYHALRKWTWLLYIGALLLLVGLFFTEPIQGVRRWFRIPYLPIAIQPSEFTKLIVVLALSTFLEVKSKVVKDARVLLQASLLVGIPFVLILKQPDLGSALILFPITLVMFYFGDVNKKIVAAMSIGGVALLGFIVLLFLGVFSHSEMKKGAMLVMKEYQYERLNPNNYHQNAAQTAISLGRMTGSGWRSSEYTAHRWLPYAYTDSVFPALVEEFGFFGGMAVLAGYFGLIFRSFQITAVAKDYFGRVLAAGISVYFAVHVIVNVGMMCGLLPVTGVPLLLITSGGSSVIVSMMALGILQSIYTRRFMF